MAFPSPAIDYVEARLTPESLMHVTQSSIIIPTDEGYAVAEPGYKVTKGRTVLLDVNGKLMFAEVGHGGFKTNDGIIEGDALDDARVLGVVTFMVKELPRGEG
ncbi:hypothetical protein SAMN05216522_10231 [Rosenbergiella nectarea]|uniref:Uncharacterized protein n=1 Tax=Rosenbergiella nectarea TaxID=988801 RepID=A0A1H9ESK0_9GAMM|nr:hypothetical protein [Rosenbergiella nectarea]SEQ28213.1 hypothetical protein SAMN05216522_10231 [Rosenbergiella nectarea]